MFRRGVPSRYVSDLIKYFKRTMYTEGRLGHFRNIYSEYIPTRYTPPLTWKLLIKWCNLGVTSEITY